MTSPRPGFLELSFRNPTHPHLEIECLTLSELRRRMRPAFFERLQRPRFHLLALYTEGEASQEIDFVRHVARPGTVLHVHPGQVLRYASAADAEARLILFTPEFPAPDALDLDVPDAFSLPPEAIAPVTALADSLFAEYGPTDGQGRSEAVMRHLLSALLLQLDRAAHGRSPLDAQPDLYHAFRRALEHSVLEARRVEDYAHLLGCAPRTLQRVAVAATGRSAKALIDERVALEAKRLLAHSSLGVGAIAARLGFSEPTNFVKFFRRVAGTQPGAFRDAARR